MTDGLDAVREVATHWRRRYQAAQALLAETQRELAEARRWSAAWKRAAVRYRHGLRNLDPRIARLERITPPGGDTVDEGRFVRRADGSFLWWSDHEREESRLYTPGDPIQGVEDMYFTGESWQTEDE